MHLMRPQKTSSPDSLRSHTAGCSHHKASREAQLFGSGLIAPALPMGEVLVGLLAPAVALGAPVWRPITLALFGKN